MPRSSYSSSSVVSARPAKKSKGSARSPEKKKSRKKDKSKKEKGKEKSSKDKKHKRSRDRGKDRSRVSPSAGVPANGSIVAAGGIPTRDFATERPEAYQAFEKTAIRYIDGGYEVSLPNKYCLDKHVPDFIACLSCWLRRSLGRPQQSRWQLQRLDLSFNDLMDSSIAQIVAALQSDEVQVHKLVFTGNRLSGQSLQALSDYMWSSSEAILELDVAENEISVPAGQEGSDPLSALLRCIYNHSSYPRRVAKSYYSGAQQGSLPYDLQPLTLRVSGNLIGDPRALVAEICSKGEPGRIHVRHSAEPYPPEREEFLSIFLPDFERQRRHPAQAPAHAAAPPEAYPHASWRSGAPYPGGPAAVGSPPASWHGPPGSAPQAAPPVTHADPAGMPPRPPSDWRPPPERPPPPQWHGQPPQQHPPPQALPPHLQERPDFRPPGAVEPRPPEPAMPPDWGRPPALPPAAWPAPGPPPQPRGPGMPPGHPDPAQPPPDWRPPPAHAPGYGPPPPHTEPPPPMAQPPYGAPHVPPGVPHPPPHGWPPHPQPGVPPGAPPPAAYPPPPGGHSWPPPPMPHMGAPPPGAPWPPPPYMPMPGHPAYRPPPHMMPPHPHMPPPHGGHPPPRDSRGDRRSRDRGDRERGPRRDRKGQKDNKRESVNAEDESETRTQAAVKAAAAAVAKAAAKTQDASESKESRGDRERGPPRKKLQEAIAPGLVNGGPAQVRPAKPIAINFRSTIPITSEQADSAIAAALPKASSVAKADAGLPQHGAAQPPAVSATQLQELENAISKKLDEIDPEADPQTQQLRREFSLELIMSRKSKEEITSELADIFDAAEGEAFTSWLLTQVAPA